VTLNGVNIQPPIDMYHLYHIMDIAIHTQQRSVEALTLTFFHRMVRCISGLQNSGSIAELFHQLALIVATTDRVGIASGVSSASISGMISIIVIPAYSLIVVTPPVSLRP
jgi:Na+/H+ antiporter NhaD/arsenite permease-like protein